LKWGNEGICRELHRKQASDYRVVAGQRIETGVASAAFG
jgi:hypothetical protein